MQVDNAQGSRRHSSETREEWHRAVVKIGRDFLIKEARFRLPSPIYVKADVYLNASPSLNGLDHCTEIQASRHAPQLLGI